jgi:hypothetical protein
MGFVCFHANIKITTTKIWLGKIVVLARIYDEFFYQILLLRKQWSPYFQVLKSKYEEEDEEL